MLRVAGAAVVKRYDAARMPISGPNRILIGWQSNLDSTRMHGRSDADSYGGDRGDRCDCCDRCYCEVSVPGNRGVIFNMFS
ncbi:protein of unknown function [Pararobbsia alpina]